VKNTFLTSLNITVIIALLPAAMILYFLNYSKDPIINDAGLILIFISIVIVSLKVHISIMNNHWYSPFSLTLIGFSSYYIVGIVVYYLRDAFFYNYEGDISLVNKICFISLISMIAGYYYVTGIFFLKGIKNISDQPTMYINFIRVRFIMYAFGFVGLVFALIFFDFLRDLPILSDNIDLARTKIMKTRGKYFSGVVLLVHAVSLNWLLFICTKHKKLRHWTAFITRLIIFATPLFFYGGRFLMLFPFIVCSILYLVFKKEIPFYRIFILFISIFVMSMFYVGFRIYGSELNMLLTLNAVAADIFPEMRVMATAITRLKIGHYMSEVFLTPIITILPSIFWKFLAISKAEFWNPIGAVVLSVFPEGDNIPGIRISALGEIYIAGGIWASTITMAFIGAILAVVNAKFKIKNGIDKYPYILFSALTPLMMPYGTIFSIMIFYVFLEGKFIAWAINGKHTSLDQMNINSRQLEKSN